MLADVGIMVFKRSQHVGQYCFYGNTEESLERNRTFKFIGHICVSSLYKSLDGFLGRHAYCNEEKIGSQESSTVITLYFETCYVASVVSPGGVVVITPD